MVLCKYYQQGYCRFGQHCRFEHAPTSKYSYRAPHLNQKQHNTYQPTNISNNVASSVFRTAVQNNNQPLVSQNQNTTRLFANNRLSNVSNTFDGNPNAKSIFAQANQNVFKQQSLNFNSQSPFESNAKSVFAQANQNIFGSHLTGHSQTNNDAANLFASAVLSQYARDNSNQPSNASNNVFKVTTNPSNVFSSANKSFDQSICDDDLYSNIEDLSKDDIEAFESTKFKIGFIPEMPPPKHLCI